MKIRQVLLEDTKPKTTQDEQFISSIMSNLITSVQPSLDVEKAFDSVGLTFLYQVLEKSGLHDKGIRLNTLPNTKHKDKNEW